jgi:hypothetical protein
MQKQVALSLKLQAPSRMNTQKPPIDIREATEEEARERFPKDYAGRDLAPVLEQIPPGHVVLVNAPRSFVLAAIAILKPRMKFKTKTDSNGVWIRRIK